MRKSDFLSGFVIAGILAITPFAVNTPALAQQEKVLYDFGERSHDGIAPYAGLILDARGNLYGTTTTGGLYGGGTVFELTPTAGGLWTETVLHSFGSGEDGVTPYAGLAFDAAGNLYGTTYSGGSYSSGTVFELSPTLGSPWVERKLYSFKPNGEDGINPRGGLIFDTAGNLYGTTYNGGDEEEGTVFELSPSQTGKNWTEQILHQFNFIKDGTNPCAGLVFDDSGDLFGATLNGENEYGTVFELLPDSRGPWTEKILVEFTIEHGKEGDPEAGLIFSGGNLYTTTRQGGAQFAGTVLELTPTQYAYQWKTKILYSFADRSDGGLPYGGVIFDSAGNLYGTTSEGGAYSLADAGGVVFKLTPQSGETWAEQVLHSFGAGMDGFQPYAGLIFDSFGNLYGTTFSGGTHGGGTVFEITP